LASSARCIFSLTSNPPRNRIGFLCPAMPLVDIRCCLSSLGFEFAFR